MDATDAPSEASEGKTDPGVKAEIKRILENKMLSLLRIALALPHGKLHTYRSPDPSKCFIYRKRKFNTSMVSVGVMSSVEKLGTPLLTIGEIRRPEGVAVNKKGEVVVAERHGHCVTVLSSIGKRLRSFGTDGSDQGQFRYPYGVALDSEANILVTDISKHCIQKFTFQNEFEKLVGDKGRGPLKFFRPSGITVNASNDRVYMVDGNDCIQVLNSDLSYCFRFNNGKGIFPYIACDSDGNVYVSDYNNHCIQVFTADGKFLRMFGGRGEGKGELREPYGITIDSEDKVYISDWKNHCISIYTPEGQFVTSFGSQGNEPGQFHFPSGLAVNDSGLLYVCDAANNRVQVFKVH